MGKKLNRCPACNMVAGWDSKTQTCSICKGSGTPEIPKETPPEEQSITEVIPLHVSEEMLEIFLFLHAYPEFSFTTNEIREYFLKTYKTKITIHRVTQLCKKMVERERIVSAKVYGAEGGGPRGLNTWQAVQGYTMAFGGEEVNLMREALKMIAAQSLIPEEETEDHEESS